MRVTSTCVGGTMTNQNGFRMRVYKFLNKPFAMWALRDRRLRIARFSEMNDPFEMLPFDISKRDQRIAALMTLERLNGTAGGPVL